MGTIHQPRRPLIAVLLAVSVLFTCRVSWGQDQPDDILVVANKEVAVSGLSLEEVKAIFLKKRTVWTTGAKIAVFVPPRQAALRKTFAQKVLHMTLEEEQRHWQNAKAMTGMIAPPEVSTQRNELLRMVFYTKGGITYTTRQGLIPNVVKVLLVIPADSLPPKGKAK